MKFWGGWPPTHSLFFCFSIWGVGGGKLVPRKDKGHFYILELVTGSKGGVVVGDQVYGYVLSFIIK